MKIGISAYNMDGRDLVDLAVAADGLGFDALWLGEHVVLPVEYETPHPTTSSKTKQHHSGPIVDPSTRLLDPWLLLGAMASVTQRLRLATGIYILPLRHPLLTARAGANAHDLSGGRLVLGIGAGWLREEFEALDVPFEERWTRTEESIEILRSAWKGGPFSFHGKRFSFDTVQVTPHAVAPPIILGGNTERALQRAVRLGDGWFSSGTPSLDEARELQTRINAIRTEHRLDREFPCYFRTAGADPSKFDRYREVGIDNLVIWADQVWPPAGSLDDKREALANAAERLGVRGAPVS
jgi:probable F420-dependent oxidoreductase